VSIEITLAIVIGLAVVLLLLLAPSTRLRRPASQRIAGTSGAATLLRPGALRDDSHVRRRSTERRGDAIRQSSVSVVIPTLNEEGSLPWVLENLPEWVGEVVLVDGLSTDATQLLARRIRPDAVVVHQFQRGKGAALRAGFAAATGDIVVMIDADGSTDPREMGRFVDSLRDGADFVKGSRYVEGGGSTDFTRLRSAGNKVLVGLANLVYGSRFTDLCYGYCAFWRSHLPALGLSSDGFEIETELVLAAVRAHLEIREVPSHELERIAGASNLNAARDGLRVLRMMFGRHSRRDPERVHFTLRQIHLPVWRHDVLPEGVERRRLDRRMLEREVSGYAGPERRQSERRETVGAVVAYRAEYGRANEPREADGRPAAALAGVAGESREH
jgi:glycosyltransferase involved in cell wall biosynthesis